MPAVREARDVHAAAQRFPWALAGPDAYLEVSEEVLGVVLGTVAEVERAGYVARWEEFAGRHRARHPWIQCPVCPRSGVMARACVALSGPR
ncbi:hypothetical protein [Streptomyces abyssomicinicus]|uniref:hypothetical protein n=1 Tax=Streptomyces abyssomicinicus TaxID=574929 RepID=UPI0013DF9D75|nr:hypothetical protein [Streptomyces abyssomicinicus]